MNIKILAVTQDDLPALNALAFESKRHWGYPEHWIENWREMIELTSGFIESNTALKAVDDRGELWGWCGLQEKESGWVLEGFWVKPEKMGLGIGRKLYESIMECARKKGADVVGWESDPNAEGFYSRMGALKVGEKTYELDGQKRVLPVMQHKIT